MARHRWIAAATIAAAVLGGVGVAVDAGPASAAVAGAGTFRALTPVRLLDTRANVGAPAVSPLGTVSLQVLGRGGVPASGVSAVVLNVTATAPTAPGFITVYADGSSRPTTSNLNFGQNETVPNLVVAPVGTDGIVDLFNGSHGTTALVADVSGYFLAGVASAPGTFTPIGPSRLMDTRIGLGATRPGPHSAVRLAVAGRNGIPAGVSAVLMNVTVNVPTASGYVTVWGDGAPRPTASNLDFSTGETVPNLVATTVGSDGAVSFWNGSNGSAQLIADVAGYFLGGTPTEPGAFVSVTPSRLLDTRIGLGATVLAAHTSLPLTVEGRGGIPAAGVRAVVLNVTVTAPSTAGFITAYADGSAVPTASNLDFAKGQTVPNLVIAPVGPDGRVGLYNGSRGTVQLVADVAGYYLGAPGEPGASCAGFTNSTGITNTTITLANASDLSGPFVDLYGSAQQATQAYAAYFNSVADICGRSLSLTNLDTQTNGSADQQTSVAACSTAFALVGSMAMFDDGGAQTAAQCGIPDLRTRPSTLARQNAANTYAASYGNLTQIPAAVPQYFVQTDPAAAANAAYLYLADTSSSAQALSEIKGWTQQGFHFLYTGAIPVVALNYTGYVSQMQALGVKYVQFAGPYQAAVRLAQAMQQQGFKPVFVLDPSAYDPGFVSNGGSAVEGTYVFDNAALFEESATNPQMQLYEHWLQIVAPGATPSYLGLYAWSTGMLFTQQALTLGGKLSRTALLAGLKTVHNWTGDGLFSAEDVGNKVTSGCSAIIQLHNGAWVRTSAGQYICGPVVTTTP